MLSLLSATNDDRLDGECDSPDVYEDSAGPGRWHRHRGQSLLANRTG